MCKYQKEVITSSSWDSLSVEEAIDYVKESKIINNKEELATTPHEAEESEGIRANISPIRIMSRSERRKFSGFFDKPDKNFFMAVLNK